LIFHPFIVLIEMILVCGLAAQGLWHLMEWADGTIPVTRTIIIQRSIAIIPFTIMLFKNYRRDTTPPNTGGEGIDVPLPSVMDIVQ
jgi:hypothetical protein